MLIQSMESVLIFNRYIILALVFSALMNASRVVAGDLNEADLASGKQIATSICSRCHVASYDQSSVPLLRPPGPNFIIMSRRNHLSDNELRAFLSSPHHSSLTMSKMPDVPLSESQVDQLVVYFKSLTRHEQKD